MQSRTQSKLLIRIVDEKVHRFVPTQTTSDNIGGFQTKLDSDISLI